LRIRVLVGVALLAGAAYFAIFGGDYDAFDLRRVRHERALEEQRAAQVQADVAELRARRDSLATDSATIERLARERYGLIRDGERLYRFADSAADSLSRAAPDSLPQPPPE
jgi:cell division protein FtsB